LFFGNLGSFLGEQISVQETNPSNASRNGVFTVLVFRNLNYLYKLRVIRHIFVVLRIRPRRIISGWIGGVLEKIPQKKFYDTKLC
jgi:hypothetical protein